MPLPKSKTARAAKKHLDAMKTGDYGTSAASRTTSAPKPRGSDLGADAKQIKARQKYEDSEFGFTRGDEIKKKKKAS